jgi:hypothetical protein
MTKAITADTISPEQIGTACHVATPEEHCPFGTREHFYGVAIRDIKDRDAVRVWGEQGIRNTLKARELCAKILNDRRRVVLRGADGKPLGED